MTAVTAVSARLRPFRPRPGFLHRVVAAGCALAIWLLGILALSPELHARLHGHGAEAERCAHHGHEHHDDAPATDHTCAVTLFQHGVDDPLSTVLVLAAPSARPVGEIARPGSAPRRAADLRLHFGQAPPAR